MTRFVVFAFSCAALVLCAFGFRAKVEGKDAIPPIRCTMERPSP
jgi:hypothetical protein